MTDTWFQTYTSNTLAGSGNQYVFESDGLAHTGRVWYRLTHGGSYPYSLLFSNVIDSTYSDGAVSRKNDLRAGWKLIGLRAAVSPVIANDRELDFQRLTFGGKNGVDVKAESGFFASDPAVFRAEAGEYLCVEVTYAGTILPNHEESIISCFLREGESWVPSKKMPFPSMIGCGRKADVRVAYLGDSITQGIGTDTDSYAHWNAVLSGLIEQNRGGRSFAYWNLGLGYGRAEDAASDGVWLEKAKKNDVVIVCYGVNDLYHTEGGAEIIKGYLKAVVSALKKAGLRVLLQTVPPFEYVGRMKTDWLEINRCILAGETGADAVFDNVPVLGGGPDAPEQAPFGGHPNAEGCRRWAEALYPAVRKLLEEEKA